MKSYKDILKETNNQSIKPIQEKPIESPEFKKLWNEFKDKNENNIHFQKGVLTASLTSRTPTLLQLTEHLLDIIFGEIRDKTKGDDTLAQIKDLDDNIRSLKRCSTILLNNKNIKSENLETQLIAFLLEYISKHNENKK